MLSLITKIKLELMAYEAMFATHDSKFGTKIYNWFISPTIQKTAHQIELWQITYLTRLKVPTMVPRQKKRYQQWFKIQYDK
jgi:hypothetical protein